MHIQLCSTTITVDTGSLNMHYNEHESVKMQQNKMQTFVNKKKKSQDTEINRNTHEKSNLSDHLEHNICTFSLTILQRQNIPNVVVPQNEMRFFSVGNHSNIVLFYFHFLVEIRIISCWRWKDVQINKSL